MLLSLALILVVAIVFSAVFHRINLPGLLGMILTGVLLGPYVLNWISSDILDISGDIREIALIVILIRAGLSLDLRDLKKVGRPAILMCFIPATLEIAAITLLAPLLFGVSYVEAAIMGAVVAAVSPAVVVPRMIRFMNKRWGTNKKIPQLIMAGASVDDIYVIVLFTVFLGMYQGEGFSGSALLNVPASILLGLALGIALGFVCVWLFKKFHIRDTLKILIILSISFGLVSAEDALTGIVPMSGLLGVMGLAGTILERREKVARRLIHKFSKIWVVSEIMLFVLVGAAVDIRTLQNAGPSAVLLIFGALTLRIGGVYLSLIKTNLNAKERLFCAISYMPKATVQAAIGAIPLSAGVASGNTILTVAVLAIMITAPIGAIGMDSLHKKLLVHEENK